MERLQTTHPILFHNDIPASIHKLTYKKKPYKYFLFIDEAISKTAFDPKSLDLHHPFEIIYLKASESLKTIDQYKIYTSKLIQLGIGRDDIIVSIGGGCVGDFVGFLAATLLRGVRFINIPTTLLSMVDSSVGGKVGLNLPEGKNLIGAFHQPLGVIINTDFLNHLPLAQKRAGYAEVIKSYLIGDEKRALDTLNQEINFDDLKGHIYHACRIKAEIVELDEKENNIRKFLNFGHTFGHAFETLSNKEISHGEAVSIGMLYVMKFGMQMGITSENIYSKLFNHLDKNQLPTALSKQHLMKMPAVKMIEVMSRDKKKAENKTPFIMLKEIASPILFDEYEEEDLQGFLNEMGHSS